MVKKKLVEGLVRDGARLLHELDRQSFPVETMFWAHLPDEDYWRLVIASPVVKQQGGAAAYQRLNELLRAIGLVGITLEDISLLDPESPQFRSLYSLARGSSRLAAGPEWLEFEDAVVYRWAGESVTGKLSCNVAVGELKEFWEAERQLSGNLGKPALLITLENGHVTLRFHPQHGPQQTRVEGLKKDFGRALYRSRPDCQVSWLN